MDELLNLKYFLQRRLDNVPLHHEVSEELENIVIYIDRRANEILEELEEEFGTKK